MNIVEWRTGVRREVGVGCKLAKEALDTILERSNIDVVSRADAPVVVLLHGHRQMENRSAAGSRCRAHAHEGDVQHNYNELIMMFWLSRWGRVRD